MEILRGGSAETASGRWVKFDVKLDETDFERILKEHDIPADPRTFTVNEVFAILEAKAETLVLLKFEQMGAKGDRSAREQNARLVKLLNRHSDNFHGGYGGEEI